MPLPSPFLIYSGRYKYTSKFKNIILLYKVLGSAHLAFRGFAFTKKMQKNYLIGRLGQVIDGTGKDYDKMKNYKELYDNMGYDSYMVFVNTSLEVALERNQKRERKLDDTMVKNMWQEVQDNLGKFQKLFGVSNMLIIDNSEFGGDLLKDVEVEINKRLKSPIKNPLGRKWMEMQLKAKKMNEAAGDGYKVYCDMDGVLADFVDQWKEYHKQDPSAHKKKIGKNRDDVKNSYKKKSLFFPPKKLEKNRFFSQKNRF